MKAMKATSAPGDWLSLKPAQALLNAPDITTTKPPRVRAIIAVPSAVRYAGRFGGAHRWALVGRMHAGGDGRRTAHGYAGAVGVLACNTIRMSAIRKLAAPATGNVPLAPQLAAAMAA